MSELAYKQGDSSAERLGGGYSYGRYYKNGQFLARKTWRASHWLEHVTWYTHRRPSGGT